VSDVTSQHIIIIGGGLAGLSAGSYARASGFTTTIVEHNLALGGVCTAWSRGPYTIDGCIDWLTGGAFDRIYTELGIFPGLGRHTLDHFATYRDYRTGNYLVDAGHLAAVLDWEFAGLGDPLEDLGWFLARCWRFGRPDREAGGIGPAHEFLAGYHRIGGRAVTFEETRFWQVMAHVRWAVMALQQAERHGRHGETSLELALTAHVVPDLEAEILALTGERA
jgi:hypothetical protein